MLVYITSSMFNLSQPNIKISSKWVSSTKLRPTFIYIYTIYSVYPKVKTDKFTKLFVDGNTNPTFVRKVLHSHQRRHGKKKASHEIGENLHVQNRNSELTISFSHAVSRWGTMRSSLFRRVEDLVDFKRTSALTWCRRMAQDTGYLCFS